MAVISTADLIKLRQCAARKLTKDSLPIDFVKADANTVFQTIEDWEVNAHTVLPTQTRKAAINGSITGTLTTAQQMVFWSCWADWKKKDLGI